MKDYTAEQIQEAISYYRKNASEFGGKERVDEACARWQALAERLDGRQMRDKAHQAITNPLENPQIKRFIEQTVEAGIEKAASRGDFVYVIDFETVYPPTAAEAKDEIAEYFKGCNFGVKWETPTRLWIYWSEVEPDELSESEGVRLDPEDLRKKTEAARKRLGLDE